MTRFHLPARLQAPHGRELWLLGRAPAAGDAEALGASLAARGLSRVVVQNDALEPAQLDVAQTAAERSGAPLVGAEAGALFQTLAEAVSSGGTHGSVVVVAAETVVLELLEQLLGVPPRTPSALALAPGRATCLRMGATGWLLAHHNVRDPGSLHQRPEGLGRPS